MSDQKDRVRAAFRDAVYEAAGYRCQKSGCIVKSTQALARSVLDAHHITSRKDMPFGGYVRENGIALCSGCHGNAEDCEQGRESTQGFMPDDLYRAIGSSRAEAERVAQELGPLGELGRGRG